MNVVSRIRFPRTAETSSLYMKCSEGVSLNLGTQHAEVALIKNGVLSFNTYFNSFYEKFYAKYTEISSLYYLLKLEGNFQVCLYQEHHNKDGRELIHVENFDKCEPSKPVKISLPDSWRSEDSGRVYLEITCLSEHGSFLGGFVATEQLKIRKVSLGIIICTFQKETYVKNTVNAILQDDFLQNKNFKIFVVDNGRTLEKDEFDDSRVELIPNRNVGGSGGFTRGLIQALQDNAHTHFLFMDDDIELESESIYRLFPLYEYASQDFTVAGAMLDLYKKHILYEAGALYSKYLDSNGNYLYHPFTIVPLKYNLNLVNPAVTNLLLSEDDPDYSGFWFFSFSRTTAQEAGLPLPFFIKVDDMEFGMRIKERLGKAIVAFPGIAVWHEPFYAKNPAWGSYYELRNRLITHSIRQSLKYVDAVKFLTQALLHKLFLFDYNSAEMVLNAFDDYMKGSELIKSNKPENIHAHVLELSKSYKSQNIQFNDYQKNTQFNKNNKEVKFNKLIGLLTLNGHLIPNFLLSDEDVLYQINSDYSDWWPKVFGKKKVLIYREGNSYVKHHQMNRSVCIGILIRWFKLIAQSRVRWSSVSSEWKHAFKDLTSVEFWKEYLKLNEQV